MMYFSHSGTSSANIGTSFRNLGINGCGAESRRGYVKGTASGASSSFEWVVHGKSAFSISTDKPEFPGRHSGSVLWPWGGV